VLLIAGLSDPAEAWTFQLDVLVDEFWTKVDAVRR